MSKENKSIQFANSTFQRNDTSLNWYFCYEFRIYFAPFSSVSVVDFEQVNVGWEWSRGVFRTVICLWWNFLWECERTAKRAALSMFHRVWNTHLWSIQLHFRWLLVGRRLLSLELLKPLVTRKPSIQYTFGAPNHHTKS